MRKLVIYALLAVQSVSANADVSPEQVAKLLEDRDYLGKHDYGARSVVYRLLKAGSTAEPMRAVRELAAHWHISDEVAAKVIEAFVLENDDEESSARLYRATVAAAPDSPDVWAMGVSFWVERGGCDDAKLRDNYLDKSFAATQYLTLDECEEWLPSFVRRYPGNLAGRFQVVQILAESDPAAGIAASRWLVDELTARTDKIAGELRVPALRQYWQLLGRFGLGEQLLSEVERYAARSDVWREPGSQPVIDGAPLGNLYDHKRSAADARSNWMFALVDAGRLDEARAAFDFKLDGDGVLKDVLHGNPKEDLFERYVGDGEKGVLWYDAGNGMLARRVSARFLAANRLGSAAQMLEQEACYPFNAASGKALTDAELAKFPAEFRAHLATARKWIEESARRAGCQAGAPREAVSARLPHHTEVPLTEAERTRDKLPAFAGNIPLPEGFELVRAERAGDELLAVCISAAVDPGGEVGRGGYWLLRSRDGGNSWRDPLYLGFQENGPYVVTPEARVSMFAGQMLRLEVEVNELDPDSITFPPVALRARREATDLYIDIPFADLERDTDGDGWSDMLEAKLKTDPAKADSDGDSFPDRYDDFPQVPGNAAPHALAGIVVDLLKRLTGYEHAGIIEPIRNAKSKNDLLAAGRSRAGAGSWLFQFVAGDRAIFAGLRAGGQVIVLDDAQLADIQTHFGPFYPLHFPAILVDAEGKRALVQWSAGWTGGTIHYTRVNGKWQGKQGSTWITRTEAPSTPRG